MWGQICGAGLALVDAAANMAVVPSRCGRMPPLRPTAEEVERALQRELEVGCAAFEAGVVAAGLDRFWQQRDT